jgi:hypothetical protein
MQDPNHRWKRKSKNLNLQVLNNVVQISKGTPVSVVTLFSFFNMEIRFGFETRSLVFLNLWL